MNRVVLKTILGGVLALIVILALSIFLGAFDIFYTKTIGKEKQNAETEVFRETQAHVDAKRRSALKFYREFNKIPETDTMARRGIRNMVYHEFATFDEAKLINGEVKEFIIDCKYNP